MAVSYKVKSIQRLSKDRDWKRYEVTVTAIFPACFNCKPVEVDYVISAWKVGGNQLVAWSIRNENGNLYQGSNGGNGQLYQGMRAAFHNARKTFDIHIGVIG